LHYFTLCSEIPINYSIYRYYHLSHKTRLAFKLYEPVWLRGRGCVSLKTHWANVWLRKKNCLLCMGLTINYVRSAGRWKAEKCCFLTRLSIQPWYTVQWTVYHASTVHWTVEACVHCSVNRGGILHCSLNSGACEQCELHCSREIFFFFSVLIF